MEFSYNLHTVRIALRRQTFYSFGPICYFQPFGRKFKNCVSIVKRMSYTVFLNVSITHSQEKWNSRHHLTSLSRAYRQTVGSGTWLLNLFGTSKGFRVVHLKMSVSFSGFRDEYSRRERGSAAARVHERRQARFGDRPVHLENRRHGISCTVSALLCSRPFVFFQMKAMRT